MAKQVVIPGGDQKGMTPAQLNDKDLAWWAEHAKFTDVKEACNAEIERRKAGGKQAPAPAPAPAAAPAPKSTAIQPADVGQLVIGTFSNAEHASKALIEATLKYHVVAPASIVGRLPEGCEVIVSLVQIDTTGSDVYNITGDRKRPKEDDTVGLDRVSLARIMRALGGRWLWSRRTDDGSHPHYCSWEAMGEFPGFDLQMCTVPGNVEIDTREDGDIRGAAAEEIRAKAERRRREYPNDKNDGGDAQLLELRKFLTRHAESKAMNKAIGNYGVRRSYKRGELAAKPFAVAKLMFTGYSEDPEVRREFRKMIAEHFLGASTKVYGQQAPALPVPQPVQQLPQQSGAFALRAPPPIGRSNGGGSDYDAEGEAVPDSEPRPTTQPTDGTSQQTSILGTSNASSLY